MSAITHGYKVLLIEDNPGDSELIEEMLLEMNGIPFTVDKAFSLLEAIKQLAQQDRPDVILVDLFLPDSQGLDSLRAVQDRAMLKMVFSQLKFAAVRSRHSASFTALRPRLSLLPTR